MYRIILLFLLLCLSVFLVSCGESSVDTKASAQIYVSQRSVDLNQMVEFDASESTYDSLSWVIDGEPLEACGIAEICTISFSEPGEYYVELIAEVEKVSSFNREIPKSRDIAVTVIEVAHQVLVRN